MVLSHPILFTDRTSWYSHIVPCLFSCLIAVFTFYLNIHHDSVQLPAPLQGLPSLQRRTGNFVHNHNTLTSHRSHLFRIHPRSVSFHSNIHLPVHLPLLLWLTSGSKWSKEFVLLTKKQNQNKSDFETSQISIPRLL